MMVLLDTNLLLRSVQPSHADHVVARDAISRVRSLGYSLCVVPQVIYEFWVVATRPIDANGLSLSVDRAKHEVAQALSLFTLLRDERAIFERWQDLVVSHSIHGKTAHDARLVAAMKRHDITYLLTFNDGDFRRFGEIAVTHPQAVHLLPAAV